jgi:spermidine synthase
MKRILRSMFGVGFLSVLVQVTLLREMLVVFQGNELSFGTIMACWLLCVGVGASGARLLRRDSRFLAWTRHLLTLLPVAVACVFPFQVWLLRSVRLLLGVGAGEYVPFVRMLGAVFLTCLPSCAAIGLFFPLACEWGVKDRRRVDEDVAGSVSRVYTAEAVGSMLGGVVLTFLLLPRLTPLQVVAVGGVVGLLAGGAAAPWTALRWLLRSLAVLLVIGFVATNGLALWEARFVQRRWEGFGVVEQRKSGPSSVRLVDSLDTVYQNVALSEIHGQYALYGDGKLQFVFPDEIGDEHRIHPLMGMYPRGRRVLVLGGNPVGDIPQLLKYPVEELVFVDLDPGVVELVRRVAPRAVDQALLDPRVTHVMGDGVRYVRQDAGPFDVILVNAPEPSTSGANRFYTVEFYESLRRILSRGGIMITSVSVSVRLQAEAQGAGGVVYQALQRVFPVVKATAGARSWLVAGAETTLPDGSPRITFDRQTLYDRSRAAKIETTFFQPEWFLGADEIDPAKTAFVEQRFRDAEVKANRVTRPAACFANLKLWSRFSGSGLARVLGSVERLHPGRVEAAMLGAGCLLLLGGWLLRLGGDERAWGGWVRGLSGVVLAAIGFFSMAMEVLLVMAFQGLYGTVYSRMGFIVAAFMLGLVVGAPTGRRLCRRGVTWAWRGLFAILAVLLLDALAVPHIMVVAYRSLGHLFWGTAFEIGFYIQVAVLGFLTGAAFPPANMIFTENGGSLGAASAITDASDHLGAALGALLVGVVLLPVLGVDGACRLMAALMLTALMTLAAAYICRRSLSIQA